MAVSGIKPSGHNFQCPVLTAVHRLGQRLTSSLRSHIGKSYLFLLTLPGAFWLCLVHKRCSQRVIYSESQVPSIRLGSSHPICAFMCNLVQMTLRNQHMLQSAKASDWVVIFSPSQRLHDIWTDWLLEYLSIYELYNTLHFHTASTRLILGGLERWATKSLPVKLSGSVHLLLGEILPCFCFVRQERPGCGKPACAWGAEGEEAVPTSLTSQK